MIEGRDWPRAYQKISQIEGFSPGSRMPNLFGVASYFPGWTLQLECAGAIGIGLLLWFTCRKSSDLATCGAIAAACGLLLGHHAFAADCTLLLPLGVITIHREGVSLWVKGFAALMLSPVPTLLLLSQTPFVAQAMIVAFVVITSAALNGWLVWPPVFGRSRTTAFVGRRITMTPAEKALCETFGQ